MRGASSASKAIGRKAARNASLSEASSDVDAPDVDVIDQLDEIAPVSGIDSIMLENSNLLPARAQSSAKCAGSRPQTPPPPKKKKLFLNDSNENYIRWYMKLSLVTIGNYNSVCFRIRVQLKRRPMILHCNSRFRSVLKSISILCLFLILNFLSELDTLYPGTNLVFSSNRFGSFTRCLTYQDLLWY